MSEMYINIIFFKLYISKDVVWSRLFGYMFLHMLHKSWEPIFSENSGCLVYYNIPFTNWRIKYKTRSLKKAMELYKLNNHRKDK